MKQFILPIIQQYWSAIIAAALAFTWIAFYTKHSGIGISPDSVAYLSTANHIAHDFIFTDYNQKPFVNFPLGYPIFLAFINWISAVPILSLAPFLNSFLFAIVLFVANHILIGIGIKSACIKLLLLLLVLSSPSLLEVYSMLWSETLFIVFVCLFFYSLNYYCISASMKWLLVSALLASLATEIRYAGVTILITGIIFILLNGEIGFVKKIFHLLIFGAIGCILPSINIIYNKLHSDTWAGVRQIATRSFSNNLVDFTAVLNEWFPLPKAINMILMSICICLVLSYSFYLLYKFSKQLYTQFYIVILSCFTVVYGLFMLFIASISRFETLSSRLISPIFIPLLVVLFYCIASFIRFKSGWVKNSFAILAAIFFCMQALHHFRTHAAAWEGIGYAGIPGYTEDEWANSDIIQHLKKQNQHYVSPIYSNANDAIYFLTNISSYPLPHKDSPSEIKTIMLHATFCLVWFNDGLNNDLINIEYIIRYKKIKNKRKFKEGTIYYFSN